MKNKLKLLVILILAVTFIGGCSRDKTNQLTAIEVAKLMGNGTNLGNTMEAFGRTTIGTDAAASDYETIWGQPVTTPEMIQGMKDAGFDSIRIPVAWTNTMNFEDGDYTINQAYLDRVEEIVNYALDADMYVIVNDHWDGGWWACLALLLKRQELRPWNYIPKCGHKSENVSKTILIPSY